MAALEFPRNRLGQLQELAVRLLGSRKPKTDNTVVARDVLVGFQDICTRFGLDGLLGEADPDKPEVLAAISARLRESDLDGGGPRNAKPQMIVDSLITGLGLTVTDPPGAEIALDDVARVEVMAALAGVMDPALALPALRDRIISTARARCEEQHFHTFGIMSALLDERGLRLTKTPKVPVDSLHAVQRVLAGARHSILAEAARTAIDRAKDVLARISAEAAERIDRPVTHKLTPRDVAISRACDPRVPAGSVVVTLVDGLTDTIPIAWRAAEKPVRPYSATQKFEVGDVLEHPKFGRGSVVSVDRQRMDVEFADTKYTLIHAK